MKKWIAMVLALTVLLSFAACGAKQPVENTAQTPQTETTEAPVEDLNLTEYKNGYFTVSYDESTGWNALTDKAKEDENGGSIYVGTVFEEGAMDKYVYVEAKIGAYEDFCKSIEGMGYVVSTYEDGGYEPVMIGGQQMLVFNNTVGVRVYIGHDKETGITFRVRTNVPDSEIANVIIGSIVFDVK